MSYFDGITLFLITVPMPGVLLWSAYDLWRSNQEEGEE